jgi:hypothetical protein
MQLSAIALLAALNLCAISVNLLTTNRILVRHLEKTESAWCDALALLRTVAHPGGQGPRS